MSPHPPLFDVRRAQHVAWRQALLLALLALATAACRRQPSLKHGGLRWPGDAAAVTVPARLADGLLTVPVAVNGTEAGWWAVDTASIGNGITAATVAGLELPSADADLGGKLDMHALGGQGQLSTCWIDVLAVGGLSLGRHPAYVLRDGLFSKPGMQDIKGLLGQNWLRLSVVTMDFEAPAITFTRSSSYVPPSDASEVPVVMKDYIPRVTARLPDGTELLLLLDTGAGTPLMLHSSLASHVELSGETYPVHSALESTQQRAASLASVTVLGRTFTDVKVLVSERPEEGALREVDGLLGAPLLDGLELTLDAGSSRLWVRDSPARR